MAEYYFNFRILANPDKYSFVWQKGYKYPALFKETSDYAERITIKFDDIFIKGKHPKEKEVLMQIPFFAVINVQENSSVIIRPPTESELEDNKLNSIKMIKRKIDLEKLNEICEGLYDYQKEVIKEMLELKRCINAMETGTGKTIMTLKALQYIKEVEGRDKFLIVVPRKALKKVWLEEINKWNLDLNPKMETVQKLIREYSASQKKYKELQKEVDEYDALVIDEAHEIASYNNHPKASYKLCKVLSKKSDYLFILTATPVVNSERDIYSYLSFLGLNIRDLREWFHGQPDKLASAYKLLLKRVIVRKEIDKGIELKYTNKVIRFSSYNFQNIFRRMVLSFYDLLRQKAINNKKVDPTELFAIFSHYISKACLYWNGFKPNASRLVSRHPKIMAFKELIDELVDERVVVIGYHRNIKLLSQLVEDRPVFIFTGEKKDNLSQFKKTKNGVLLLSIRAGGLGINLENVDHVIFFEYWWTWVSYKQAVDRIARITSQNKEKKVINLISVPNVNTENLFNNYRVMKFADALIEKGLHSLDLWMINKIMMKKNMLDKLLEGNKGIARELVKDVTEAYEKATKDDFELQ